MLGPAAADEPAEAAAAGTDEALAWPRFLVEFEVDRELSDEDEAELEEDELLEAEPDSEPLESEPDSLDRDRLRDARLAEPEVAVAGRDNLEGRPPEFLTEWPLSRLLLVLLQVDMGLAAPRSLFRYTLEDLTDSISEAEPPDTDEEAAEAVAVERCGDNGASFQLELPIRLL